MRKAGAGRGHANGAEQPPAPLMPISVRVPGAVRMTGISRTKLYELIKAGDIEVIKLGAVTLIPVASLARFIESQRG